MTTESEFLTFREGSMWICVWRRYDVVSQGKTEKEACERMLRIIVACVLDDLAEGRAPLSSLRPPSEELLARWTAAHARSHPPKLRLVR
jgi:hypothetical protein